ncbi:putative nuclease domain protein [Galdieria sulphuraria]|uniref:Putative nuclease domain protein n=1 Tax=Galdieria sulphuraria TaxID=130081 RepID=M2W951_GALSU|nr:putative nuclease domain protein [Galdieria sulphuraria]EME32381.1 putative nuclease domain protein [Galdieria sulphuraria]|eukprot:XP_005708901.1 putative nuclease domain protein [Galdieria sulphuraria]
MVSTNKFLSRREIVAAHIILLSIFLSISFLPVGASSERKVLEGQVRVIDGDTIRFLNGPRVRLNHIDAPELKQTCLLQGVGKIYHCGKTSKETLEGIIGNHKIYCESDKLDVYGRWLGTCWTLDMGQKGININQRMVQLGEAVTYKGATTYRVDEEAAKVAKKGIWSSSFQWPWEFRKTKRAEL